jgi:hypothetical protein
MKIKKDTALSLFVSVVSCPCGCEGWALTTSTCVSALPATGWVGFTHFLLVPLVYPIGVRVSSCLLLYFVAFGVTLLQHILDSLQGDFPHS